MEILPVLYEVKKKSARKEKSLFQEGFLQHPGRMPSEIITSALEFYGISGPVGDPMFGIGSTGFAALERGLPFSGCEIDPQWFEVSKRSLGAAFQPYEWVELDEGCAVSSHGVLQVGNASEIHPEMDLACVFTSPPFPNAHSPGSGEAQQKLVSGISTFAGTEYNLNLHGNMARHKKKVEWIASLCKILRHWVDALHPGGYTMVHIKNHVKQNKEVRVDLWVKEALEVLGGVVLGYHPIPLRYGSWFNNLHKYYLREVIDRVEIDGGWLETLSCQHFNSRSRKRTANPDKLPLKAHCVDCGEIPGRVSISEERLVVARFGA